MATLNVSINIPDEKVTDLVSMINFMYPTVDGVDRTPAEAQAFVKNLLVAKLTQDFNRYKRRTSSGDLGVS